MGEKKALVLCGGGAKGAYHRSLESFTRNWL